jgi:flagellum-specific peptidoglycan hydrolase FlgJ
MASCPHDVIDAARAGQAATGIPASILLAQWALESAWGRDVPPGSMNPFGEKALPGQPSITAPTREWDKTAQRYIRIEAPFRKYDSLADAFLHHAQHLATSNHYAAARTKLPDPFAFADALTGIYATAPEYGRQLGRIMRVHDLTQYDMSSGSSPGQSPGAGAGVPTPSQQQERP